MELAKQLSNNYIFRGLPREVVAGMAAVAAVRRYDGGTTLVRQFDNDSDLYIILEGGARIRDYHGETLAEFGPGSVIGEMALIDENTRSATVVATGPTIAAVIPASYLKGIMTDDPTVNAKIVTNISRVLCRRLRTSNERVSHLDEPHRMAR